MNDDFLKNLSDEQKAQLKNCKSKEELLSFAMKSGQELSDEVLDAPVSLTKCLCEEQPIANAVQSSLQLTEQRWCRWLWVGHR